MIDLGSQPGGLRPFRGPRPGETGACVRPGMPIVAGAASATALLDVRDLSVSFASRSGAHPPPPPVRALDGVSLQLRHGEVLAIVGESGSGKSVCAMTLMGLTRGPTTTISGSARLQGEELIGMDDLHLRRIRGRRMAMVFQDPQSSLNPVQRVGDQIAEQIRAHTLKGSPHGERHPEGHKQAGEALVSKAQALARAGELMERVGIPLSRERVRAYPHELSGGMRQRVMIAMALSLGAPLLLADEPTTALDVTVQAQILAELKQLQAEEDLGIALITHDFGIVADIADRIAVMQDGRVVEQGTTAQIFDAPSEPYTRRLLDALAPVPRRAHAVAGGAGDVPAPMLEMQDVRVEYRAHSRRFTPVHALAGVSLSVRAGETLAVVGESGCGKTTLLRTVAGLVKPSAGAIRLDGEEVTRAGRGRLGMVFQDPQASLNPRRRVGATLERAVRQSRRSSNGQRASAAHRDDGSGGDGRAQALRLLERVGLSAAHAERYPHELSGGQRQRVGIARALVGEPRLVLLDEPVSSLDASLRRGVIELLDELQDELGCAYVVVSHDLGAVEATADRIAVMRAGKIVEIGSAADVLQRPQHPYTRELLAARPAVPFTLRAADRVPSSACAKEEI